MNICLFILAAKVFLELLQALIRTTCSILHRLLESVIAWSGVGEGGSGVVGERGGGWIAGRGEGIAVGRGRVRGGGSTGGGGSAGDGGSGGIAGDGGSAGGGGIADVPGAATDTEAFRDGGRIGPV